MQYCDDDDDDYLKYKKIEKQLKHLKVLEEYIKMDMRNLEKEIFHAQEEVFTLLIINSFDFHPFFWIWSINYDIDW